MNDQDQDLLMFIYFEGFMFWRPIEIVRITVNDIDLESNVIRVQTKTKALKTKIIPNLILNDLKNFLKGRSGIVLNPKTPTGQKLKTAIGVIILPRNLPNSENKMGYHQISNYTILGTLISPRYT